MVDSAQGCEGSARGRGRVASGGKTTLLAFVLFFIRLDLTWAAGGFTWKWGTEGQNCVTVCTLAGLACVDKFSKVDSQAAFQAASDGSVSCGSYYGQEWTKAPMKWVDGDCVWQTGSTTCYTSTDTGGTRLCSCQCAAGTYSTTDLKPYPCSK